MTTTTHTHRVGRLCDACADGADSQHGCWNCGSPYCEGCYGDTADDDRVRQGLGIPNASEGNDYPFLDDPFDYR